MELFWQLEHLGLQLLVTAQMLAVILTTAHILLGNRDVASTVGWTGLVWLAPLIGLLMYWIFGVNRIQRKAHRLRPQGTVPSEAARPGSRGLPAGKQPLQSGAGSNGTNLRLSD
jgi:cardiolipin synthase